MWTKIHILYRKNEANWEGMYAMRSQVKTFFRLDKNMTNKVRLIIFRTKNVIVMTEFPGDFLTGDRKISWPFEKFLEKKCVLIFSIWHYLKEITELLFTTILQEFISF